MKTTLLIFLSALVLSCAHKTYPTNGETIYKTGKNKQGQKLLDKSRSDLGFISSCQACHGKQGKRNPDCIIKWSYLSDASKYTVPYNDSLFFRFLDLDEKSNGNHALTGVHWNMSNSDKLDLIAYLKNL